MGRKTLKEKAEVDNLKMTVTATFSSFQTQGFLAKPSSSEI